MASSPLLENRGPALEIGKNFAIDVLAFPTCIMKYATAISPLQMNALKRKQTKGNEKSTNKLDPAAGLCERIV